MRAGLERMGSRHRTERAAAERVTDLQYIFRRKAMKRISLALVGAFALATSIAACGNQGYGPTHSESARVGSNGTVADATANNGSTSSSYEAQRQKVDNYNGYQPGYR
jgi:predicted small lipoprotein YifL